MNSKINHQKKIFFLPNILGGVSSVLKNLTNENDLVILTQNEKTNLFDTHSEGFFKCETKIFNYQTSENLHHICNQLSKFIKNKSDIIIVNDWLELEMCARLGINNPIVQIIHGNYEYYYSLAKNYQQSINRWVAVSEFIANTIKDLIPERSGDSIYMPIGVQGFEPAEKQVNEKITIIFVGRLTEDKGFFDLFKIDDILKKNGVNAEWTIAGDNSEVEQDCLRENFSYLGKITHTELNSFNKKNNFFILPSRAEGFPVSLIEAMKSGLIPLVSNLKSGIPEIIQDGENGFVFEIGECEKYAEALINFNNKTFSFNTIRNNVLSSVKNKFTLEEQRKVFFNQINSLSGFIYSRKKYKILGSRMDKNFIPNKIVYTIRNIRDLLNGV